MCIPSLRVASFVSLAMLVSSAGCSSVQLRRISVRQANSVAEIYEQQALDNLAKFVVNPYSTASFSVVTQATNGVRDQQSIGLDSGILTGKFWEHISGGGEHAFESNFTWVPVVDPNRLALMQCAYQRAVGLPQDDCSECCKKLADWTGNPHACIDSCGITSGWICKSTCRKDVPKCCQKYGEYCGVYIWVEPCQQKEFAKLMSAIIDYASGETAETPKPTKNVVLYLNEQGHFAPAGKHVQEVHAAVPMDANAHEIEKLLHLQARLAAAKAEQRMIEESKRFVDHHAIEKRTISLENIRELDPLGKYKEVENLLNAKVKTENLGTTLDARLGEVKKQVKALEDEYRAQSGSLGTQERVTKFGPPTQFNNPYYNNLLQQKQLLNTVPNSR